MILTSDAGRLIPDGVRGESGTAGNFPGGFYEL